MSGSRYIVISTEADGRQTAFGPFSVTRADAAVAALEAAGVDNAVALYLYSSGDLTDELPDWRRVVA